MLKKRKIILNFFYFKSILFLFFFFILKVNAETKIIGKEGDTLIKLSNQYDIPLKELMHKNKFINANISLEGEVILIPFKNKSKDEAINKDNKPIKYKVIDGDTLYKISRDYNVNIKDIISINNFKDTSIIKPDQIILLPGGAIYNKSTNNSDMKLAIKKVNYHQTSNSEELKKIAEMHKVSIQEIINLNKLKDPTKIEPNTKLKIRESKSSKWLKYGSIILNWSNWRYLDGNYITQAKNKKNRYFHLAISCKKRTLNNTLGNNNWASWYFPKSDFEFKLINDFCDKDIDI
tara:strand:+ start:731 stop:1603 length:873 start_codon:yes stop_codon:yes gene_type:complete